MWWFVWLVLNMRDEGVGLIGGERRGVLVMTIHSPSLTDFVYTMDRWRVSTYREWVEKNRGATYNHSKRCYKNAFHVEHDHWRVSLHTSLHLTTHQNSLMYWCIISQNRHLRNTWRVSTESRKSLQDQSLEKGGLYLHYFSIYSLTSIVRIRKN